MNMKKISHEMNLQKWTQIVEECRNSGQMTVKWCVESLKCLKEEERKDSKGCYRYGILR